MKKITTIAYPAIVVLSLAAAFSAHAQSESMNLAPTGPSATTRAQVQAELFQARKDGSMKVWSAAYNPVLVQGSERSRAEVRAEAVAAARDGYAHIHYGEDSGAIALAKSQRQPAAPAAIYAGTPQRAQ